MHHKISAGIAAVFLILSPLARAADLPVKAAPNKFLTYPTACGIYYGAAIGGSGGGSSTDAISGAQVLAGDLGVLAGYTCPFGQSSFWFAETIASVSKVNGGAPAAGLSVSGSFSSEQRFAVGTSWANIQQLVSVLPGLSGVALPSIPGLPAGVAAAGPAHFYVFAGAMERDISALLQPAQQIGSNWLLAPELGFGQLTRLTNGMVVDTWIKYQPQSTTLQLPFTNQRFRQGDFVGFGMALKL